MLSELARQDQISNDLANAATPGYKPDRSAQRSFSELLLENRASGQIVGPLGTGAAIAEVRTDLSQGPLRQTGQPLDLALEGDGFFAVKAPQGIRYTRDGQFSLDAQRHLVTATGLPVLDEKGNAVTVPSGNPTISPDG